jgi:type II secretory pathway pseudopilin PulG
VGGLADFANFCLAGETAVTDNPYEFPENAETIAAATKRKPFSLLEALVVIGIVAVIAALILPATRSVPKAGTRVRCMNNIKNITLALLNYADTHKAFPPAYTVDARGNRLHSWRTLLLPYLDQQSLYESIDFSKPWNHPANAKAFNTQLEVFSCWSAKLPPCFTTYLGNATADGCFSGERPRRLSELTDPPEKTIVVAEVASTHAVHWMSPEDADDSILLNFDAENKTVHFGVQNVGLADGTVMPLSDNIDRALRRALMTISGNETFDGSEF